MSMKMQVSLLEFFHDVLVSVSSMQCLLLLYKVPLVVALAC